MAKGKASPALNIQVWHEWAYHPKIVALREAGHHIEVILDDTVFPTDLVLHPAAHKWNDQMWESPYLKAALSDARKLHRERKKKA